MGMRYQNILETIGNTPVVRINNLAPEHVNLYAKIESFNPMGSVKDRLALGVIEDAERRGELKPGQTIVEATSGNTGIGLAMVCAQKAYPLVVVMAENFSVERRRLMRFLGARVILTPASEMGSGMVAKTQALAQPNSWPVRKSGQCRYSCAHHGRGNSRGFFRYWPRLLGIGIRHRRHLERCVPRAEGKEPGNPDHGLRAG
jgi:cysteine synthase A